MPNSPHADVAPHDHQESIVRRACALIFVSCLAFAVPALAEEQTDIAYRGWGLRVGVSDSPDQVLGGFHVDLGEFVERLRFRPDLELGFGDDVKTLFATAPVHYRFDVDTRVKPYAGGGISLGWVDPDRGDSDFEIGFKATGGVEWPNAHGRAFFVELELGFGDVHDVQIVGGWAF